MWLKLSCYHLKIDYYNKDVSGKPHNNHKEEISIRYTKGEEKEIKEYQYKKKSTNHKGRQQERRKGIKELENNEQNSNSKSLPINNYFICKWNKLPN